MSKSIFDEGKSLNQLELLQSTKVVLTDEEQNFFLKIWEAPDFENDAGDTIGGPANQDEAFLDVVDKAAADTSINFYLEPAADFKLGILKGKLMPGAGQSLPADYESSLSWITKQQTFRIKTTARFQTGKLYFVTLEENPEGTIQLKQPVYYIQTIDVDTVDGNGRATAFIVTFTRIASQTINNGDGDKINFNFFIEPIKPINAKFVKITFEIAPLLNLLTVGESQQIPSAKKLTPESLKKWYMGKFHPVIAGGSIKFHNDWGREIKYPSEYVNVGFTDFGSDANLYKQTSDGNGRIDFPGLIGPIDNCIPNTEYLVRENPGQFIFNAFNFDASYKDGTDANTRYMGLSISSPLSVCLNNYRQNTLNTAWPQAPWQTNNGMYINDMVLGFATGLGGGEDDSVIAFTRVQRNPAYWGASLTDESSQRVIDMNDLCNGDVTYGGETFGEKMDSPLLTNGQSLDIKQQSVGSSEDRSFLMLIPYSLEESLAYADNSNYTYANNKVYDSNINERAQKEPESIADGSSGPIIAMSQEAFLNRAEAEARGIPTDVPIEWELSAAGTIGVFDLIYYVGATMIIEYFDENHDVAVGLNKLGQEVGIAPMKMKCAAAQDKTFTRTQILYV